LFLFWLSVCLCSGYLGHAHDTLQETHQSFYEYDESIYSRCFRIEPHVPLSVWCDYGIGRENNSVAFISAGMVFVWITLRENGKRRRAPPMNWQSMSARRLVSRPNFTTKSVTKRRCDRAAANSACRFSDLFSVFLHLCCCIVLLPLTLAQPRRNLGEAYQFCDAQV